MSTFLNAYADAIPMSYSPTQALDVITGHLTANGVGGARKLGGVVTSWITVTEIA